MSANNNTMLAFPKPGTIPPWDIGGLTLRDFFAALAMHGDMPHESIHSEQHFLEGRARAYYRMADAMLDAREAE